MLVGVMLVGRLGVLSFQQPAFQTNAKQLVGRVCVEACSYLFVSSDTLKCRLLE